MTSASSYNTRWSLVQAAKGDTPQARAALSELCEIYYRPIEAQMHRWLGEVGEAREMTQAFFAKILQGNRLTGAEESSGRFRNYLFAAAHHFMASHKRAQKADKRGLAVTESAEERVLELADQAQASPDVEFDRAWACALLSKGLETLEAELKNAGKGEAWKVLKPWLAGTASHGDTAQAAARLGASETAVRVQLSRLRQRLRGLLEQQIADTLAPGADLQAEVRHLLALWG